MKEFFNNKVVLSILGILLLLLIVPVILKNFFKDTFNGLAESFKEVTGIGETKAQKAAKEAIDSASEESGFNATERANLEAKAVAIGEALGRDAWYDWTQDTGKALKELVGVTRTDYAIIAQYYAAHFSSYNLTSDLKIYCTDNELKDYQFLWS